VALKETVRPIYDWPFDRPINIHIKAAMAPFSARESVQAFYEKTIVKFLYAFTTN